MNKEARIRELEASIRRHRELYYNATPEISDVEFDGLEDELRDLDPSNEVLTEVGAAPGASTKGGARGFSAAGLPLKVHKIPMGSLEKIAEDRLEAWAEKAGPTFLVQEKLDGISMELEFEKGRLVDAITRGDGRIGEVVTHNAVHFRNTPTAFKDGFSGSLRGEVILRKSVFEEHFVGADFANPRNTVSGLVRKKHGDRSLARHLELRFYDVVAEGRDFETERRKIEYLRDRLGVEIAVSHFDKTIDEVREIYRSYQGEVENPGLRFTIDYEIDGLVVRSDSIVRQEQLGFLRGRPRFAFAYKFPSAGEATVLRSVDWSLGLGSAVT